MIRVHFVSVIHCITISYWTWSDNDHALIHLYPSVLGPLVPPFSNCPAPGALSDRAAAQRDQASAQCSWPLWGLETCMIDHQFDTRKYIRISEQMTENNNSYISTVIDVCKICASNNHMVKNIVISKITGNIAGAHGQVCYLFQPPCRFSLFLIWFFYLLPGVPLTISQH